MDGLFYETKGMEILLLFEVAATFLDIVEMQEYISFEQEENHQQKKQFSQNLRS